jgi:hypothetical protein
VQKVKHQASMPLCVKEREKRGGRNQHRERDAYRCRSSPPVQRQATSDETRSVECAQAMWHVKRAREMEYENSRLSLE